MTEDELNFILQNIKPSLNNELSKKNRIYLRDLSIDGLNEMHEYSVSDKNFYKYLEYEPFKSIEDTRIYLLNLIKIENESKSCKGWFVINKENDKIIGTARLINIDYKRKSVSWGYGIDSQFWGKGYVQELQIILLEYIFDKMKFNRLYGTAMLDNKQTITTLKSIGMKEEGIHPEAMRDSTGRYRDSWSYGLLSKDYFENKKKDINKNKNKQLEKKYIEEILSEYFKDYQKLDYDQDFSELEFWDSLSQMELVAYLERKIERNITVEEIIKFSSIRKIIEVLIN